VTGDDATLARLMAQAQRGDRQSYAVLLEEASLWLARYFRRKVRTDQIDDLVQEVLLALHQKRATYEASRPFLPWLAAIARYRWVDHLRKVYRGERQASEGIEAVDDGDEQALTARLSLDGLLSRLPPAQAQVIELVKIEGRSIREVSQCCGQSEPLVKVNIHRGLKKLAGLVEEAN
jgi:RNA polymerase sigma-70 factor (ECF subfamily)